jgi:type IV secretory pathway VirB2 component (pilin)
MEDIELIKKLQYLREIKPRKEWVFFAKRKILSDISNNPSEALGIFDIPSGISKIWQNLFTPIQSHFLVFTARAMALVMVIATGVFFYFSHLNFQNLSGTFTQVSLLQNSAENEKLLFVLGGIQANLKKIDSSLSAFQNSKNKKQTLAMTGVIKATANSGEQVIKEIKRQDSASQQILASLNELETGFKEMGEKSYNIQIKMIKIAIDDLKQRNLNEEDAVCLQKVENYYNEKQYNEAMLLLSKIMD